MEGNDRIRPEFGDVWRKAQVAIAGRVATIEGAIDAIESGSLEGEQAKAAIGAAHRLAGVLGTFGLDRGSELARELESGLQPPRSNPVALGVLVGELGELIASAELGLP